LILRDVDFMAREQSELEKAKLLAKPIKALSLETPLLFNGCKLVKDSDGDGITMIQKGQGKRIEPLDPESRNVKQAYLEQRARGAYIGTICQPKALYDLSVAA
jgi:hypothetical protein